MRLFIAIPLPKTAEIETATVLDRLHRLDWPVRWVRSEGLHLTLKFFGETTGDRVDAIVEMMNYSARGMRPVAMSLHGAAVFPSVERPKVINLGVDAEGDLELLQDRLERGSERLAFQPEGRLFKPHITLGRVREGQRLPAGWQTELEKIPPGQPFLGDRAVLFESHLGPDGPTYAVRHEVKLG